MDTIAQIDTKKLIEIAKAHGITWLALFGSMARGEATGASDVDLAVRFDKPISLFDLVGAQLAMEAALGRAVDLIPMDDAYPFVRQSMANDLVVLYEASKDDSAKQVAVNAHTR
jgi:uncharacterized protein